MSDQRNSRVYLPPRDSHDLSLSPRDITRDSLVTSMLLSLDQFSSSNHNSTPLYPERGHGDGEDDDDDDEDSPQFFDVPRFRSNNNSNQLAGAGGSRNNNSGTQWRGHGHSYSSDFEGAGDDVSSRMSSQWSRGRRSNSSSNFPEAYSRFNGARSPTASRSIIHGHSHGHGGKAGSKSSSVGSFDVAHFQGNPFTNGAPPRRGTARTASLDSGDPLQMRNVQTWPQLEDVPQSPFRSEPLDNFLDDDDIDAAPNPTVPSGPRKSPSTPAIPRIPPEPKPSSSSSQHRNRSSSRSIKSSSGRGKTAFSRDSVPPLPMPLSSSSMAAATAPPTDSAAAAAEPDSAPAPSVGYGKSKTQPSHATKPSPAATPTATPQPKEKQSFFKRVFGGGSSKNSTPTKSNPSSADAKRPSNANLADDSSTSNADSSQQRPKTGSSNNNSKDAAPSQSNHPTLQKKTSSFFRRRKRATTTDAPPIPTTHDDAPPPVPPLNLNKENSHAIIPDPERSPVSSLQEAMNPYLRRSANAGTQLANAGRQGSTGGGGGALADITNTVDGRDERATGREEFKRDFSPDYEPSPKARIRKVHSNIGPQDENQLSATPSKATTAATPTPGKDAKGSSFLDLDGVSDNDDEHAAAALKGQLSHTSQKAAEPNPSPHPKRTSSFVKGFPSVETSSHQSNLGLPIDGAQAQAQAQTQGSRAPSPKPSPKVSPRPPELRLQTATGETGPKPKIVVKVEESKGLDEPDFVVGEPTEDDRAKAQKIYDGNEDFIQKDKAAAWMGEEGPVRQRTLTAYMELYDFANHSVVFSLRQVCGRLVLRAETQQVDRILVAFSKRWCDCNPNHGFKATDIIHTICYSIMLLNTDLHMADIEQKMTRSQFVKNTMGTITQALVEAVPGAFDKRPSILPEKGSMLGPDDHPSSAAAAPPTETEKKSFRNSFRPPPRRDSYGELLADCGPLVKGPYYGTLKGWEEQVEIVLKGIYMSIRDERLPLFGADPSKSVPPTPSPSNLSVIGMLKRTPSVLSKAPSEGNLSLRGRITDASRPPQARWASKSRSRQGGGRNGFNSSRTSFDDGNSLWSPALSSATWSRQSLGRTQTTFSQDSFGSSMPRGDYQQSIGFANALSQAIIRDEDALGNEMAPSILSTDMSSTQFLEDESLEITGAPWVKEGMVIHKHHLDGVDKKARDRNWTEVFAVVQKGQMSLFSFTASKSQRHKSRTRNSKQQQQQGPVGGGNWQDNATCLGTFNLRHTLASALPPPGYSRTRPHVWALSLPTGAVHLFQVGTADIIKEFVTTANYWSARLSTHPLTGGVSNMEYGWSESIVNNALVTAINDSAGATPSRGGSHRPGSSAANGRKSSISSFRSASIDHAAAAFTHGSSLRGKLPGDRVNMAEWSPPTQSLRPSNLAEAEQLETLTSYLKGIEDQLQVHNSLRSPMLLAYTPRGYNAGKAMTNWERKSAYLLHENVKFSTYVDCLQQAEARKQEIYTERGLAHRVARGELVTDGDLEVSDNDNDDDDADDDEGDVTIRP